MYGSNFHGSEVRYIDFILVFVDACPAGNVAAFTFNDDSVARSYDIRVSFCTYSL